MKKIAVTSMYANPLHPGHIECLELSKKHADELIVIINNDVQACLKRGVKSFQDEQFRMSVVKALKPVDRVVLSIDEDATVCKTLTQLFEELKNDADVSDIVFTKGGDRFAHEIPEQTVCKKYNVAIVDGLGTKTHNSSSYIQHIENTADRATLSVELASIPNEMKETEYIEIGQRPWGVYYVLENQPQFKVKKIIVKPGHRLSLQSHEHRSEHWVVVSGIANVEIRENGHPSHVGHQTLNVNEGCYVPKGFMHRLTNASESLLVIIEVQCGENITEDDIKRYEDDYARVIK